MTFEEEFLAKIADALNVPADLMGQDFLGTLTQTELQAYEASRRFWREFYRMQDAYERTYLNSAVMAAMLYAAIWTIESYCGYDPQKLLPSNRRCEMCLVEFEAEHHWHHIREYWIERSHFCEGCSQARFLNMAALFDPKAIMDSIYSATGLSDFLKLDPIFPGDEIVFDKLIGRRLAPFVTPITGRVTSQPEIQDWQYKRAIISVPINADYGEIERRILAASVDPRVRHIQLDVQSPSGEIGGPMILTALYDYTPKQKVAKKPPPSYMRHDPTKQHGRRRRK